MHGGWNQLQCWCLIVPAGRVGAAGCPELIAHVGLGPLWLFRCSVGGRVSLRRYPLAWDTALERTKLPFTGGTQLIWGYLLMAQPEGQSQWAVGCFGLVLLWLLNCLGVILGNMLDTRSSVYLNRSSVNKNLGASNWDKNLIDPRNSGGSINWPYSLHFSHRKAPEIYTQPLLSSYHSLFDFLSFPTTRWLFLVSQSLITCVIHGGLIATAVGWKCKSNHSPATIFCFHTAIMSLSSALLINIWLLYAWLPSSACIEKMVVLNRFLSKGLLISPHHSPSSTKYKLLVFFSSTA